jgi:hypothetical protein
VITGVSTTRCHAPNGQLALSCEASAKNKLRIFIQLFTGIAFIMAALTFSLTD